MWSLLELLSINANHYVNVGALYEDFKRRSVGRDPNALASDADLKDLMELLTDLRGMCNYMRMSVSVTTLDRMIKEFAADRPRQALVIQRVDQWYFCFTSELESQLLLIVLPHRHSYYSEAMKADGINIGQLINSLSVFPLALFDAREAGNCFAFERFTACVYHLMRCSEFGLMSVARSANVPEEKIGKGWDGCIQGIDSHVKTIGSTKPTTNWQDEVKKYSDLSSWFTAIQKGWRNPASHAPRIYSEDTASGMFSATRTLFEHLKKCGFKQVDMLVGPLLMPEDI
jgi:hypothetical protein